MERREGQRLRERRSKSPREERHHRSSNDRDSQRNRRDHSRDERSMNSFVHHDDTRRDYDRDDRGKGYSSREDRYHDREDGYHRRTEEREYYRTRESDHNGTGRQDERRESNYRDRQVDAQHRYGGEQRNVIAAPIESRVELPLHPILAQIVNPPPPSHPRQQGKNAEQQFSLISEGKPNPYLDIDLIEKGKPRDRRTALKFHPRGKFVSRVTQAREQATLDALIKDIAKTSEKVGLDLDSLLRPDAGNTPVEKAVSVEWWDVPFVPDGYDGPIDYSVIDHLIQQPSFFEPLDLKPIPPTPAHLTEAERKKARRIRRLAEQADHQDMIKAGLIPPDPSRTKLSSLPALLAANVEDPTKVESRVRREVEARHRKHLNANKERKLTPEERAAKTKAKLRKDAISAPDGRVHAALYKFIKEELTIQEQFKIVANARQLYLCGALIVHPRVLGVIVEGGPKPLERIKRLFLNRMPLLNAVVVWEGVVVGHSFCRFDHLQVETDFEVRRILIHAEQRGMEISTSGPRIEGKKPEREMCLPTLADVEHYWTMLINANDAQ